MTDIKIIKNGPIATIVLNRGKVNAINVSMVKQMQECLEDLEKDREIASVILTGHDKFFSFGFDVPEFLSYSKESFNNFLTLFTNLYAYLFLYPKPVIAALNGHTMAGGCMLAIACDHRIMVPGKAKISLNELNFGSAVFSGITRILKFCAGQKNAQEILYSGNLYTAEEAINVGLIDEVCSETNLMDEALKKAEYFSKKPLPAFTAIKHLLRKPVLEGIEERASIEHFVDIWYSETTWKKLKEIKIN